ncbi:MAG: hypothetical protein Q9191_002168 [Dirinaria sp. TL-2023a]
MDKATAQVHADARGAILKGVSGHLPSSHMIILDDHLAQSSMQQTQLMKQRIDSIPREDFDTFTTKLANVTVDRFCSYLKVSVTEFVYFLKKSTSVDDSVYEEDYAEVDDQEIPQEDFEENYHEEAESNSKTSIALSLQPRLFGDKRVPQEIYDMIIEELFRAVYTPGIVIPSQNVDYDGHACFADIGFSLEKSRLCRDINPILYGRFKELYWSDNTWCVTNSEEEISRLSLLENLECYDQEIRIASRHLIDIWLWKFKKISGLRLNELTLDFTDSFSIEGDFLGLEAATDFHPFTYDMPKLTIHAPTKGLEDQLRALIAAKNSQDDAHMQT